MRRNEQPMTRLSLRLAGPRRAPAERSGPSRLTLLGRYALGLSARRLRLFADTRLLWRSWSRRRRLCSSNMPCLRRVAVLTIWQVLPALPLENGLAAECP